jgi:hypothetical protein
MAVTSTSLASQLSIGLRRNPSPKLDSLSPTSSFFDSNLRLSVSSAKPSRTVIAMAGSGKVFLPLPLFLSVFFFLSQFIALSFQIKILYILLLNTTCHCNFSRQCNSP